MTATYHTWRRKNGLASWTFSVPMLPTEDAAHALRRCTAVALAGLDGFARVHDVDLTTVEHGEQPRCISGPVLEARGIEAVFDRHEQIRTVSLSLDLLVMLRPVGDESAIERAGLLELEIDEYTTAEHILSLYLSIDIDIYCPVTWRADRKWGEAQPAPSNCSRARVNAG